MTYVDDKFREQVRAVLASPAVSLPPRQQRLGAVEAEWFESDPGIAVIQTTGGTSYERTAIEWLLREHLACHGYRQAKFSLDGSDELRKTADWDEIMAKAKRLVSSGNVTVLRNGYHDVVGYVIGDHGEYQAEISREDPNSRVITQWQCECPWDQYAWQRTRKWKKYEGRPCAHVMALYWKALSTPLDEDAQGNPVPRGQRPPEGPGGQQSLPGMPPPSGPGGPAPGPGAGGPPAGPQGAPQGAQDQLFNPAAPAGPPPGQLFDPGAPQSPMAVMPSQPPAAPGVLPQFPGEQMQMEMQWQPGSTPGGGVSPPHAVSVPGAKQQTVFNPLQYPGGTYSKVAAADLVNGQRVMLLEDEYGQESPMSRNYGEPVSPDAVGQFRVVPKGSKGEVLGQDPTTGWVEVIFDLEDSGPRQAYHVKCYLDRKQVKALPGGTPFIRRR